MHYHFFGGFHNYVLLGIFFATKVTTIHIKLCFLFFNNFFLIAKVATIHMNQLLFLLVQISLIGSIKL